MKRNTKHQNKVWLTVDGVNVIVHKSCNSSGSTVEITMDGMRKVLHLNDLRLLQPLIKRLKKEASFVIL